MENWVRIIDEMMADVRKVTEMEIRRLVNDWTVEDLRAKIELRMTGAGG